MAPTPPVLSDRSRVQVCAVASLLALSIYALGCRPAAPQGIDSPLPQERMEAAVDAAERKDQSAVPGLVAQLDSDDPAVRFVAIHSLMKITGEDLGYDHAADEQDRKSAVDRWEAWVKEHHFQPRQQGLPTGHPADPHDASQSSTPEVSR